MPNTSSCPADWSDSYNFDCAMYAGADWCTPSGQRGGGWCSSGSQISKKGDANRFSWGAFHDFGSPTADAACPECGAACTPTAPSHVRQPLELPTGCVDWLAADGESAWRDSWGYTCDSYRYGRFCELDGSGRWSTGGLWSASYGSIESYAWWAKKANSTCSATKVHALKACCACGGGVQSSDRYDTGVCEASSVLVAVLLVAGLLLLAVAVTASFWWRSPVPLTDPAADTVLAGVRTWLSHVPAESGGIALNLAGMGSWLSAMCELHPALLPAYDAGAVVFVSLALVIILAVFLQALLHNAHLRGELKKPKQCGSYGGLLMGLTLCCSYARFLPGAGGGPLPFALVHAAGSLQLAMLVWYLGWTYTKSSPPVPYWFPATVGIGMAGIAGSKVGMAPWLQQAAFWLSAALCLVEWPWITARCLFSDRIAPAPSIFIHAAPISLVSLAYMEVIVAPMEDAGLTPTVVGVGHFFFAATTCGALVTLFFAYRRRTILRRFVLPRSVGFVHQEWAGLTFPLVATSSYAILYAARIVPLSGNEQAQTAAVIWATALGLFTLLLVGTIDIFYLVVGLPQWVFLSGLPPVPGPPPLRDGANQLTGEKACCKCWPPFGGRVRLDAAAETAEIARRSFIHRSGTLFGIQVMMADAIPTDLPTGTPNGTPPGSPMALRRSPAPKEGSARSVEVTLERRTRQKKRRGGLFRKIRKIALSPTPPRPPPSSPSAPPQSPYTASRTRPLSCRAPPR